MLEVILDLSYSCIFDFSSGRGGGRGGKVSTLVLSQKGEPISLSNGRTQQSWLYFFLFSGGDTQKICVFILGRGSRKESPYSGPYSVAASCSTELRKTLRKIKVVWKNPGVVALHVVMCRRDEVKCEGPSHPPPCLRLFPGTLRRRKRHFHSCFLGLFAAT